ncbi:MAG: hypothetical protein D6725_10015 [Planctomycetota bacterium]|nr:MAG: hypothetical protein D6725_10015 [Planctomycetota bacterium]
MCDDVGDGNPEPVRSTWKPTPGNRRDARSSRWSQHLGDTGERSAAERRRSLCGRHHRTGYPDRAALCIFARSVRFRTTAFRDQDSG